MANQRRSAARNSLGHLARDRRTPRFQSPTAPIARRVPACCEGLRRAGCRLVYLDGSFVTTKEHPGDFDACWDIQNVNEALLDPVFWDFSRGRAAQKQRFLGEFFPAQLPEGATGRAFVEFFQVNRLTGGPKGILVIRLKGVRRR